MKTNRPELVLSFSGVTGHARKTLAFTVQQALFKLGYFWPSNPASPPIHLDAGALFINSQDTATVLCINKADSASPLPVGHDSLVFDAATDSQSFLDWASKVRVVNRVIQGVSVQITFDSILLDATALVESVMREAKGIQKTQFGQ
jgi:hypothetical protein